MAQMILSIKLPILMRNVWGLFPFVMGLLPVVIFDLVVIILFVILTRIFNFELNPYPITANNSPGSIPLWWNLVMGALMALCLWGLFRKNKKLRKK